MWYKKEEEQKDFHNMGVLSEVSVDKNTIRNYWQNPKPHVFLTAFFARLSSSSWSKELSSSLNRPTSSQFLRKRVGVGVWSGKMQQTQIIIQSIAFTLSIKYRSHVMNVSMELLFFRLC